MGRHNVKHESLINSQKVLLPPLHLKLGLMKEFVTALNKKSTAFKCLQDFFPKLSEANGKLVSLKIGPQVRKIIKCSEFPKKITGKEKEDWESFVLVS